MKTLPTQLREFTKKILRPSGSLFISSGLILSLLFCSSISAQISKSDLQGDWIKFKAEREDGSRVIDRQKTHTCFLEFKFMKGILCINKDKTEMKFCRKFKVKDNVLSIDDLNGYVIESFQNDTLVLLEQQNDRNDLDLKRLYFTRDALFCASQEKKYEDDVLVATSCLCPDFQNNFVSYIYDKLKKPLEPCQFKGYLIIDREAKTVNTSITGSEKLSAKDQQLLIKIINKSYKYWTYKDHYTDDKYKIYFVGKALENGGFENLRFSMYTNDYQDLKMDQKDQIKQINKSIGHYNTGMELYAARKFEEAIVAFSKAYELDDTNLEAIYTRITLYNRLDKKEEACKDLEYLTSLGQLRAKKMFERKCGEE